MFSVTVSFLWFLSIFTGVFGRCRNKELLQEDGLWAAGTVYGEGPGMDWTWTMFFICTLNTVTHTHLFVYADNIGQRFCSVFSGETTVVSFSLSPHFLSGVHWPALLLYLDKETQWEGVRSKANASPMFKYLNFTATVNGQFKSLSFSIRLPLSRH